MQKLFLFLLTLVLCYSCSKKEPTKAPMFLTNQIERLDLGTNDNLVDICFSENGNGIIIGASGFIAVTSNGGETWKGIGKLTNRYFKTCYIDNNGNYYVGGRGMVTGNIYSQDLRDDSILYSYFKKINAINFSDTNNGIVAYANTVISTKTGGTTWDTLHKGSFECRNFERISNKLICISYGDDVDSGWYGGIHKSINNGDSFSLLYEHDRSVNQIDFLTESNGFFIDKCATLFHTSNFGKNWESVGKVRDTSVMFAAGYSFRFITDKIGFAPCSKGLLKTTNGGQNWKLIYQTENNDGLNKVKVVGSSLFGVGLNGHVIRIRL